MNFIRISKAAFFGLVALSSGTAIFAQDDSEPFVVLPGLYVTASHTAMVEPASTYGTPVSRLELDPQIDLQVRGMAEGQGDVTIRGGIFENTGFRIGAATLLDPQTGHYFAEIPIAPEMLRGPNVLVGAENALGGFNSTVGTIDYSWIEIEDGGSFSAGFGDHDLNYQRLHHAQTFRADSTATSHWAAEFEASRSESDGTIEDGDHDFVRYGGRLQRVSAASQTDIFAGYQSKYLAWPELYAAPYNSKESDDVQTTLLMVNHQQSYGTESQWEATAYYRQADDHYLFNRFSDDRSFVHQTKVSSAAVAGRHQFSDTFALSYSSQIAADEIESTRLENSFTSRSYGKVSILPEFVLSDSSDASLLLRAGATYDTTNRDPSKVSPIADLTWTRGDDSYYISLSQTTQVPGYTAIGGGTSGLFASNPNLSREVTRNAEIGATIKRAEWSLRAAGFVREDADLVDWTYALGSTSARSASNVDIDTYGLEIIASRRFGQIELLGSYTFLDKNEDYGSAAVDGSFYALNHAKHRITAAAVWSFGEYVQLRIDNEYREQRENLLREGSDSALFTHVGVSFRIPDVDQLELRAAVENLWKDDFQEIPGTPGRGRQLSLGATWNW